MARSGLPKIHREGTMNISHRHTAKGKGKTDSIHESIIAFCSTYVWAFIIPSMLLILIPVGCTSPILQAGHADESRTSPRLNPVMSEPYSSVLESSYSAADRLAHTLKKRHFSFDTPIMAASFANIDNLTDSSTFGRIVSEQVANRLAQHGFRIVELKLRQESVFIKKGQGEFILSRELKDLGSSREIRAALVGTYAISRYFIFVSARIVTTEDSMVLAGCDYEVPNDAVTQSILK